MFHPDSEVEFGFTANEIKVMVLIAALMILAITVIVQVRRDNERERSIEADREHKASLDSCIDGWLKTTDGKGGWMQVTTKRTKHPIPCGPYGVKHEAEKAVESTGSVVGR